MASVDTIGRIEGSIQDGGWKAEGAVLSDADRLLFYQQIGVWFDAYLGGGWENLPRHAFRGHLLPDPWTKTFQASNAPFTAFTGQEFLKRGEIQGIFYRHVALDPANRHQIINMNYAKIIYEMIGGHCSLMHLSEIPNYDASLWAGAFTTIPQINGFLTLDLDLANSSSVAEYDLKQGNFWQRLQDIANIEFFLIYLDKFNKLHYVPHPMFNATLPDPVLTITASHLMAPLQFERRNTEKVGQVKLSGTTPQGLQISGKYPANPTAGPVVSRSGYMATASTLMTTIATRMYKFENRDYTVTAVFPNGIGLLLDLLDRVAITYTSSADGIAWSSKKFWINKIGVDLLEDFNAVTTLVMDAEAA